MGRFKVVFFTLISVLILFSGCSSDETPAEPTPDLQLKIQTKLDMEKWLLDARLVRHVCGLASDKIKNALEETANTNTNLAAAAIVDHFQSPSGLTQRLNEIFSGMKVEEERLAGIPEKDVRIFDNLKVSNSLNSEYVKLIETLPESPQSFMDAQQRIDTQLASIFKTLSIEYPQSNDEFDAYTSEENMNYRSLLRQIQTVPTPGPESVIEEETLSILEPSPTPTTPPIQTWRDKDGVLHMGYHPPEGSNVIELKSQLSGSVETSESQMITPDTEASKSMIWTDENGVTHMGHDVPDGFEAKPADDIPLMISK